MSISLIMFSCSKNSKNGQITLRVNKVLHTGMTLVGLTEYFDLSEDALGINDTIKSIFNLLDSDLLSSLMVLGREDETVSTTAYHISHLIVVINVDHFSSDLESTFLGSSWSQQLSLFL